MENQREAKLQQRKGSRLLLFPVPLQGHMNPMFELGEILHSKGFSITIIDTKFNAPKSENYPHFKFHFLSDGPSNETSTTDILGFISDLNTKYIEPCRSALSQLLANPVEDPIACLISDALLHFTRAVAESFELPRIVLRTGGISSFHVFATFPLLQEKGYLPIQDSRLEEPILELPPLRVKDLPVINGCNMEALCELLKMMVQETMASSGLIWNSFEELEEPSLATLRDMLCIPIFPIGPFHKCCSASSSSLIMTPDEDCISWLDKQEPNSVIYVSFGSIAAMNEKMFLEIAWALANSNHPFLWVVRPRQIQSSEWLESLPSDISGMLNGKGFIVKWAPQLEVLSHPAVGAFWTHNGWNSTLESICEGVPMISMPFFTDQLVNARYVTHVWKVGLPVEIGWNRERITSVIKKLMMEDKEGEEIRNRMSKLKEKAELCLRPGGSSYESLKSLEIYIPSL